MGELSPKLRARWDALIGSEGKCAGLTRCRPFLENKTANDIFYEGTFKGRPCIVKCSSKSPDSIANEYKISRRMFAAGPECVAEPLSCVISETGDMAFAVFAKIAGPSLTELLENGISKDESDRFALDLLSLSEALDKTGTVHRDLFPDNLLLDSDGHLKAIDFQFAIDRNDYCESAWMRRNWKYRYVVFGVNHDLGAGRWNDAAALERIAAMLPETENTDDIRAVLRRKSAVAGFSAPPAPFDRLRLELYALSLKIQILARSGGTEKAARLRHRLRRIKGSAV